MKLEDLRPEAGSRQDRYRKGRGHGSGNGKTAGKGHKGQNARSGGGVRPGFEGGQTPLYRRMPKRGFNNKIFTTKYAVVNVDALELGKTLKVGDLSYEGLELMNAKNAVVCAVQLTRAARGAQAQANAKK